MLFEAVLSAFEVPATAIAKSCMLIGSTRGISSYATLFLKTA